VTTTSEIISIQNERPLSVPVEKLVKAFQTELRAGDEAAAVTQAPPTQAPPTLGESSSSSSSSSSSQVGSSNARRSGNSGGEERTAFSGAVAGKTNVVRSKVPWKVFEFTLRVLDGSGARSVLVLAAEESGDTYDAFRVHTTFSVLHAIPVIVRKRNAGESGATADVMAQLVVGTFVGQLLPIGGGGGGVGQQVLGTFVGNLAKGVASLSLLGIRTDASMTDAERESVRRINRFQSLERFVAGETTRREKAYADLTTAESVARRADIMVGAVLVASADAAKKMGISALKVGAAASLCLAGSTVSPYAEPYLSELANVPAFKQALEAVRSTRLAGAEFLRSSMSTLVQSTPLGSSGVLNYSAAYLATYQALLKGNAYVDALLGSAIQVTAFDASNLFLAHHVNTIVDTIMGKEEDAVADASASSLASSPASSPAAAAEAEAVRRRQLSRRNALRKSVLRRMMDRMQMRRVVADLTLAGAQAWTAALAQDLYDASKTAEWNTDADVSNGIASAVEQATATQNAESGAAPDTIPTLGDVDEQLAAGEQSLEDAHWREQEELRTLQSPGERQAAMQRHARAGAQRDAAAAKQRVDELNAHMLLNHEARVREATRIAREGEQAAGQVNRLHREAALANSDAEQQPLTSEAYVEAVQRAQEAAKRLVAFDFQRRGEELRLREFEETHQRLEREAVEEERIRAEVEAREAEYRRRWSLKKELVEQRAIRRNLEKDLKMEQEGFGTTTTQEAIKRSLEMMESKTAAQLRAFREQHPERYQRAVEWGGYTGLAWQYAANKGASQVLGSAAKVAAKAADRVRSAAGAAAGAAGVADAGIAATREVFRNVRVSANNVSRLVRVTEPIVSAVDAAVTTSRPVSSGVFAALGRATATVAGAVSTAATSVAPHITVQNTMLARKAVGLTATVATASRLVYGEESASLMSNAFVDLDARVQAEADRANDICAQLETISSGPELVRSIKEVLNVVDRETEETYLMSALHAHLAVNAGTYGEMASHVGSGLSRATFGASVWNRMYEGAASMAEATFGTGAGAGTGTGTGPS